MAKVTKLEDCVLELNGIRKCAFCGRELADGEVCTCNNYKLVLRNLHYIEVAQGLIDNYQNTINDLYDRMPEPSYEIREAIVAVPPTPESHSEGDEEALEGNNE